jgi:hypothetical protein
MMEFLDKYFDHLISSIFTLIGVFISWWLKYQYGERKSKIPKTTILRSKLIQSLLDSYRDSVGANRAFIMQRHNGGKYENRKSMAKLSTTFESTSHGTESQMNSNQNIPMSIYSDILHDAIHGDAYYEETEKIQDAVTHNFFTSRKTKSGCIIPLYHNSNLIGIVGFEWTSRQKKLSQMVEEFKVISRELNESIPKLL